MQIGRNGIEMLKSYEGIEDGDPNTVNLDPYMDSANIWTIGYGHALFRLDGSFVKGPDCEEEARAMFPGGITVEEAEQMLAEDSSSRCKQLDGLLDGAETTQNQYDAMLSLLFNIGSGNFAKSDVRKHHIAGDYEGAAAAFRNWNRSGGKVVRGLINRRELEISVYTKPDGE
jgi:lysozyme